MFCLGRKWRWFAVWGIVLLGGCKSAVPEPRQARAEVNEPWRTEALATFDEAWRILNETYFDPEFHGVDWNAVRTELRGKAAQAESIFELRAVVEEMLGKLGQSHMTLIPGETAESMVLNEDEEEQGGDGDLGLDVRWVEGRMVVSQVDANGPAAEAGVKPGWVIQKIGNKEIPVELERLANEVNERQLPFLSWRMVAAQLEGLPGATVRIEFLNERDDPVSLELQRRFPIGDPVKFGHFPMMYARFDKDLLQSQDGPSAGLIRFNLWMVPIAGQFDRAIDEFRDSDGIILDLRSNVGGIAGMIVGISGHFLREQISLGTMKMRDAELRLIANPRWVNHKGNRVEPFDGPVAVLIDPITVSASELFAGGMQDIGRARIFGERSAGQALPALLDRLPNGDILYHAVADFVTPSGDRLEGDGVVPDVEVPLKRKDLLAGRDRAMEAALEWIRGVGGTEGRRDGGRNNQRPTAHIQ